MPYKNPEDQVAAARRHYEQNKPKMKARAKVGRIESRARNHAFILSYLEGKACIDCGEADPIVLEFDHRGDKLFDIGTAPARAMSLTRLAAELEKCDVRCANCHRRKTYRERRMSHRDRP